ncbi:single-stranded DNA-binding protein [Acidithiobacillus sp.]|uniref:single-stranded DNA-binding protein n=1 Tax=Acidithiobacillus sp. TaxID=1872118 RepID=UPI003CFEF260
MTVNHTILLGNNGRDPEIRTTSAGTVTATLSLATNEVFKDRQGNRQERTEWHRVVAYGRIAEIVRDYVSKGDQVYIEGRLHTNKWTDKDGVERYSTEIVAERLRLIGGRRDTGKADLDSRPSEDPDDSLTF